MDRIEQLFVRNVPLYAVLVSLILGAMVGALGMVFYVTAEFDFQPPAAPREYHPLPEAEGLTLPLDPATSLYLRSGKHLVVFGDIDGETMAWLPENGSLVRLNSGMHAGTFVDFNDGTGVLFYNSAFDSAQVYDRMEIDGVMVKFLITHAGKRWIAFGTDTYFLGHEAKQELTFNGVTYRVTVEDSTRLVIQRK